MQPEAPDPEPFTFYQAACEALHDAKRRADGESPCVPTGFADLDHALGGGLEPCTLVTVAARPRMGKTAILLEFALQSAATAIAHGHPVLFYSLEVGRAQLGRRVLAGQANVGYRTLRRPKTRAEIEAHRTRLVPVLERLKALPHLRGVDERVGVDQLVDLADRHLPKQGPAPVVVVDYLQRLREPADRRRDSRERIVAEQAIRLKEYANARSAVVIVGAQLNREVEGREGHTPRLSDLRESGAIEQESDVVMLLQRPCLYDPKADKQELQILLPKQREAESGVAVRVRYDAECQRFGAWAETGQRAITLLDGG
jgi:replicative DNA helicase